MKRFLIALTVLVLLPGVVFLVFFTESKYRVKGQGYFQSLSDFVFMVGTYNSHALGIDPPQLTDESYERVMRHAHPKVHYEVEKRVVWSLTRWGEAVAPRLVREIEAFQSPDRVSTSATALGRMQYAPALPTMVRAFDQALLTPHLQIEILDALAELGPEAAPFLIETYQTYRAVHEDPPYNLLDAIGYSGGGVSFLIAEIDQAETADEVHRLEWPLAKTGDPRAARVLVSLLRHPRLDVRQRARDSMSQFMGAAAVDPALDLLEVETDDYLRSWIIRDLLASRQVSGSPRTVEFLGKQLNDPIVGSDANYALARIGTEDAIEHLRSQIAHRSPRWVMDNLEYTGNVALRIFEDYLHHPEGIVRRAAVGKILDLEEPEAIDILRRAADDSDPRTRRYISNAIHQMDLLLLERSFIEWFSQKTGTKIRRARPPSRKGVRVVLSAFSFLHWVGLGITAVLGFLLLSGGLRTFEPYKFTLTIQFLLVLGIVGDFIFMSSGPRLYSLATAGRLILLLGLLFLRDDPLPGETEGRVERLAVRSLWVLVPSLLFFGVPVFSEALRQALRDFDFMKWALLFLAFLTVLLFEQALLPWDLFARGGRVERALAFALSCSVVMLFAFPVWRWMNEHTAAGQKDQVALGGLFLLPLFAALVFHANAFFRRARTESKSLQKIPPSPKSIRTHFDGEQLLIRLRQKRRFRGLPQLVFGLFLLAVTWWLCHSLEVVGAGGAGLFLMMLLAVLGTVIAWLVMAGLSPTFSIQVREGAVRSATTFLGAAFGRPVWYRKLRLPALVQQLSLEPAEKRWLTRVLGEEQAVPHVELSLRAGDGEPRGHQIPMELQVQNRGKQPVRLADVEAKEKAPWTAVVNGAEADVFFTREERESLIPPGTTQTFHPRLYAPGGVRSSFDVLLRCGPAGPLARLRTEGGS